jgi:hypothetical protein
VEERTSLLRDVLAHLTGNPDAKAALAGALGGITRWIVRSEAFREGLAIVSVGAICSWFLWPVGPAILKTLFKIEVADKEVTHVFGFLIGAGGITLIRMLVSYLKQEQYRIEHDHEKKGERARRKAHHIVLIGLVGLSFLTGIWVERVAESPQASAGEPAD